MLMAKSAKTFSKEVNKDAKDHSSPFICNYKISLLTDPGMTN